MHQNRAENEKKFKKSCREKEEDGHWSYNASFEATYSPKCRNKRQGLKYEER